MKPWTYVSLPNLRVRETSSFPATSSIYTKKMRTTRSTQPNHSSTHPPDALLLEALQEIRLSRRRSVLLVLQLLRELLRECHIGCSSTRSARALMQTERDRKHSLAPSPNLLAETENARDAGAATDVRNAGSAARANVHALLRAASMRLEGPATWRRARIADIVVGVVYGSEGREKEKKREKGEGWTLGVGWRTRLAFVGAALNRNFPEAIFGSDKYHASRARRAHYANSRLHKTTYQTLLLVLPTI